MKNESDNLFGESNNSKKPIVISKEERLGLMEKRVPQFEKVGFKKNSNLFFPIEGWSLC